MRLRWIATGIAARTSVLCPYRDELPLVLLVTV